MKVLISPDKFKGSLSALQVCEAVSKGIWRYDTTIEVITHPLADGGEGTLDILESSLDLNARQVEVNDPLFRPIMAEYKIGEGKAYIEMAAASGLPLLQSAERNCLYTTTYGTGELILDAINLGVKEIFLFVGGSATNDAGMGMAAALGYQFLDKSGDPISPVGEQLPNIHTINSQDLKANLSDLKVTVVCDVKSKLYGADGAAYLYGAQKGANPNEARFLDEGLRHFSKIVENTLGYNVSKIEGGGAAGGIGAGAVAFLNAGIKPGIQTILDITHFDEKLPNVDLIITGEGKLDEQTIHGKVIHGVDQVSRNKNIPYMIICGIAENLEKIEIQLNASKILQVKTEGISIESAIKDAYKHVENRAFEMIANYAPNTYKV